MTSAFWVAVAHLAGTAAMVGLIWTIHAVHYPLFGLVGDDRYPDYQREHMRRITRLLVVPWATEGCSALALVVMTEGSDRVLALIGLALLAVVVAITGLGAAPIHGRLIDGFDGPLHDRLMQFDLLRALGWTLRLVVAVALVGRLAS